MHQQSTCTFTKTDSQNVHFGGHFEGIEFNLLLEDSEKIPELKSMENKLLVKGDTTQEIDFADTEFVLAGININFYSTEGLIDTQNLGPIFNVQEQTTINNGSVPTDASCRLLRSVIIRRRR